MAFKQRSAFKAKEGGSAFKEMGSVGESPMKWKAWKKFKKGVKKAAKVGVLGVGGMAVSHLLGKKKSGSGTFNMEDFKRKMKERLKKAMLEKERKETVEEMTDTSSSSNAIKDLKESNPWLPEQG
jgi:D-arabinose 1-dehydrogenase-like Zn-dependent alcohol dehydrogenase